MQLVRTGNTAQRLAVQQSIQSAPLAVLVTGGQCGSPAGETMYCNYEQPLCGS
jgi:hypothetical protein